MYVITGATGNTGKPLTLALLEAGKKVRVLSRSKEKAQELVDKGAEVMIGESSDYAFLEKAFEGATAVYAMIPLDWTTNDYTGHQMKHADAMAKALEINKVPFVVSLSSVGADLETGGGVVTGLGYMEKKFNAIEGLNTLQLRATYFFENTLAQVGVIKSSGIMGSPVKGDLNLNMIATADIGNYAAKRLLALDFTGKNVQYLLGKRDTTYNEVARIFGTAIGKPDLSYVEFPASEFKKAMAQMGASENVADKLIEFINSLNEGKVLAAAKRDAESTTSTGPEEFAPVFAHVYNL